MKEMIKSYLLKQYSSIGNLQATMDVIMKDVDQGSNSDYICMLILSSMMYRKDLLKANDFTMSSEEQKLWDDLLAFYSSHELQSL